MNHPKHSELIAAIHTLSQYPGTSRYLSRFPLFWTVFVGKKGVRAGVLLSVGGPPIEAWVLIHQTDLGLTFMQASVSTEVHSHFRIDLSPEAKPAFQLLATAAQQWLDSGDLRGSLPS